MAVKSRSTKTKSAKLVAKFKHPMSVEIIVPAFVPLAAASALDVQKLSKGSHAIEVGYLEGGCCPKLVRAVMRNGMVTRLDVDACEEFRAAIAEGYVPGNCRDRKEDKENGDQISVEARPGEGIRW